MNEKALLATLLYTGTFIYLAGFLPHLIQIVRRRGSGGQSMTGWVLWLMGTIITLIYGMLIADPFTVLTQLLGVILLIAVIILLIQFRRKQ